MPKSESVDPFAPFDGRALAVDFVENKLPDYHPLFRCHSSRYDPQSRHFVAAHIPVTMPATASPPPQPAPNTATEPAAEPPAEVKKKLEKKMEKKMEYWDKIFPDAMAEFKAKPDIKAPKKRKAKYEIRNDDTWDAVYGKLEAARKDYTRKGGFFGTVRQVWRWTADNATETLGLGVKLTPKMDIVTPVLGAVDVLLKAARKAAEVRDQALKGFEGVEDLYSDVEVFLGSSGEDEGIKEKAVRLVANLLVAIERVITLFISSFRELCPMSASGLTSYRR
jgi:hypothetical protein